jgi:crossover junction endodeoxyribonuclease RuvC
MIIGCDPGLHGAMCFMDDDGEVLNIEDMPLHNVMVNQKQRPRIAVPELADLLRDCGPATMICEVPKGITLKRRNHQTGMRETMPVNPAGMLILGEAFGVLRGIGAAYRYAFVPVEPAVWKKVVRCPASKDDARRLAAERFPAWARSFARKKDDGRAEAVLIALYGRLQVLRGKTTPSHG